MRKGLRFLPYPLLSAILGICSLRPEALLAQQVAIIVNKSNEVGDLNLDQVKKIFLGDKSTWPNGRRISVLARPSGQAERDVVLKQIYRMADSEYNKYFMQAAFTGRIAAPPKETASSADMKRLVAENPGAIGYIKKEEADDSVKTVLTIP